MNTTTGRSRRAASDCIRSSSSKPLMSGSRRSTTQQSNDRSSQERQRLGSGSGRGDFDVVVRQQLDDALALDVVVLDHQQPLLVRRDVGLDAIERVFEVLGRRRLDQVRKGAMGQPVLALLLDRQHLHRNVTRRRIELEVVEDGPSQHVGQEDVQRDGGRQDTASPA